MYVVLYYTRITYLTIAHNFFSVIYGWKFSFILTNSYLKYLYSMSEIIIFMYVYKMCFKKICYYTFTGNSKHSLCNIMNYGCLILFKDILLYRKINETSILLL